MSDNAKETSMPMLDAVKAYDATELSIALNRDTQVNEEIGAFLTDIDDSCEQHMKHKNRMMTTFTSFLQRCPKFSPLMDYVDHKGTAMPRLFAMCACETDEDTSVKAKIANTMLAEFSAQLRMKKPRNGCPWYQPSSHSQMLRTLLAAMKVTYGWDYCFDSSFNFSGGVSKVTSALYKVRAEKYDTVSTINTQNYYNQCLLFN